MRYALWIFHIWMDREFCYISSQNYDESFTVPRTFHRMFSTCAGEGRVQARVRGCGKLFTSTPWHLQSRQFPCDLVVVGRLSVRHSARVVCHRTLHVRSDRRLLDTTCRDVTVLRASRLYFRSTGDVIRQLQGMKKHSINSPALVCLLQDNWLIMVTVNEEMWKMGFT